MSSKNQCLLILGESKIGKSTILKKIINNLRSKEYNVGGFITKPKKLHKNEFGFDTLTVNSNFECNQLGFSKIAKLMSLGSLNAMGISISFSFIF